MQRHQSIESIASIVSCRGGDKKSPPTHVVIQREGDNKVMVLPVTNLVNASVTRIKINHTTTFKEDINSRKQQRGRILQQGTEDLCNEQLQILEMASDADRESVADDDIGESNESETCDNITQSFSSKHLTLLGSSTEVDTSLTLNPPNGSKKPTKNVGKNKNHIKSKPVQIDEYKNLPSSNDDEEYVDRSYDPPTSHMSLKKSHRTFTVNTCKATTKIIATNEPTTERHKKFPKASKSQIIVNARDNSIEHLVNDNTSADLSGLVREKQFHDIGNNEIIRRFDDLSKKCAALSKENTSLQLECDRLTKENQYLKRSTMPIPDAAGRQWFVNMAKYFSNKTSDPDVSKYAKALKIDNPRDLIACIQDTTSNTARQIIRLLYTNEQLLTMTGPEVPYSIRSTIREFAESQTGPISNHKFNEAVNGVFRSKKCEMKTRNQPQKGLATTKSNVSVNTQINHQDNWHKNSKQVTHKNQCSESDDSNYDKENFRGVNNSEDDEY